MALSVSVLNADLKRQLMVGLAQYVAWEMRVLQGGVFPDHGYKGEDSQWVDLWSTASQVDFIIARAGTDHELEVLLDSDDSLETMLRHLGAFFYESRTQDRTGAAMMRAVATPGVGQDVVPQWLVTNATAHAKAAHQRVERVRNEVRLRGKGDGKDKNKDGGKKTDMPGKGT